MRLLPPLPRFVLALLTLSIAFAPAARAIVTTALFPANAATSVCADTPLQLTFDTAPTLGTSGTIKIYNSSNTLLQTIDLALNTAGAQARTIGGTVYQAFPVLISGNTAHISPPADLPAGQTVYVTVDSTVFPGFAGLSGTTAWRFTTKATPSTSLDYVTVNADGTGNFATIQGAIDWVPANNTIRRIIDIRDGTYREIVRVNAKHNLHFRGQNRQGTVLTYPNNNNLNPNSSTRTLFYAGGNDLIFDHLTLLNSTPAGGSQAEALIVGGLRNVVSSCDLRSYQDTFQIRTGATAYVHDSLLEGDVDFVWGSGAVVFQNSEIKSLRNGYVCQMRNAAGAWGAVFLDCRFTASVGVTSTVFNRVDPAAYPGSSVAVLNATLGAHLTAAGWQLDNATAGSDVSALRFWEHQSRNTSGTIVNTSSRLAASRQLSASEASALRVLPSILGGWQPVLPPRAFPTAEGHGARALGGRGGDVYYVTNLNSSGAGSFRNGLDTASGPRTILFKVSGYIPGTTINKPRITIAGQSAPGDGISFRDLSLRLQANDLVVRHVRSRLGTARGVEDDSIGILGGVFTIVDHCSASWSVDETLSVTDRADNVTVQWSKITESLDNSIHSKGPHGFGSLVRPDISSRVTFHHNLYAHHRSRNPRLGSYNPATLRMDFRNNLIYNWGGAAGYSGDSTEGLELNYVGNYLLKGANGTTNTGFRGASSTSRIHQIGNRLDIDLDGVFDGADPGQGILGGTYTPIASAYPAPAVITDSAPLAAQRILVLAGARPWRRDAVDARVVAGVVAGSGTIINSTDQAGGYPVLASATPPIDGDNDGLPDYWELALGLSVSSPDNNGDRDGDGYTNLEEYLEWLSGPVLITARDTAGDIDLRLAAGGRSDLGSFTVSHPIGGAVTVLADGRTARFTPDPGSMGLARFTCTLVAAGQTVSFPVGVLVTPGLPSELVWRGSTSTWDLTSLSFTKNGAPASYQQGDNVTFDGTGLAATVSLSGTLTPGQITVSGPDDYTFSGSGVLSGGMTLRKTGAGTLAISGAHTFSGGVELEAGTLVLGQAASAGTGTLRLGDHSTLRIGALKPPNPIELTGSAHIEGGSASGLAGLGRIFGSGRISLTITTGVFDLGGDMTSFNGTLAVLSDFTLRFNGSAGGPGFALDLGGEHALAFNRSSLSALTLGNLRGGPGTTLRGASASAQTTTFTIGALGDDAEFAGVIADGTNSTGALTALTKVGAGTLTLSGVNTYRGPTHVSAGTLRVTGSLATTAVSVASGATLSGGGTIAGPVTLAAGALFDFAGPGPATLNLGSNLILSGGNLTFALQNTPAGGGDRLVLSGGSVTLNGNVTITPELLGGPLQPGTYTLISGASSLTVGGALLWGGETGGRQSVAFDTSTPGTLRLVVTGSPANLVWAPSSSSSWDLATSNWKNGAGTDRFHPLDSVTFNDSSAGGTVSITTAVAPRSLTVDNTLRNYVLAGRAIAGTTSLVKSGTGTLTLTPTVVTAATATSASSPTATVTSAANLSAGMIVTGTGIPAGTTLAALDGTTLTLSQNATANGTPTLTYTVPNSYSGGTRVEAGALTLSSATAAGTGPITLAPGATLNIGALKPANELITTAGHATVTGGSTGGLAGLGKITGPGTLRVQITAGVFDFIGDLSAFTGTLQQTSALAFRFVSTSGGPFTLDLGTGAGSAFNRSNLTAISLGNLRGSAATFLRGASNSAQTTTYTIGAADADATFSGSIADGTNSTGAPVALVKVGAGVLTLAGANPFTGTTTVADGTLRITGSLGSAANTTTLSIGEGAAIELAGGTLDVAAVDIASDATFTGRGTILASVTNAGALNVDAGQSIAVSGDLDNTGVLILPAGANLTVTGAFTNTGTLRVHSRSQLPGGLNNAGTIIVTGPPVAPRVLSFTLASGVATLTVDASADFLYQLQRATSLAPAVWSDIGAPVPGPNGNLALSDPAAPSLPAVFYRISVSNHP